MSDFPLTLPAAHIEGELPFKNVPFVSVALTLLAAAVFAWPGASEALQYERATPSEWWRLATCHVAHWSGDMLFWDAAAFLGLGALCERRWRARFAVCVVVSALAISAVVALFEPKLETYRGLSGIDSALFGLASARLLIDALASRRRVLTALILAGGLGFLAKIVYEALQQAPVFADNPAGAIPVPSAHLTGLALGVIIGLRRRER